MKIEFPEDGGVLIVGDDEELRGLAEGLEEAAEDGQAEGQILTDEGIERVSIRRESPC